MSDEADKTEPRKTKGLGTDQWEKVEKLRSDDRAEVREENKGDLDRLERVLTGRAEAAEKAATLWFRLALALVAVLSMLVAGVVTVGAGVDIPGIGSFSVNKAVEPAREAPRVEAENEGAEAHDDAEGGP